MYFQIIINLTLSVDGGGEVKHWSRALEITREERAQYGRVTLKLEGQSDHFISLFFIKLWLSKSFCDCIVNIR